MLPSIGGVNGDVAHLVPLQHVERLRAQLRREVDHVVRHFEVVAPVGRRLGRERLRRGGLLARHVRLRHGPFLDRPDRLTSDAIEDVEIALLARRRATALIARPPTLMSSRHRRRRIVEVPERWCTNWKCHFRCPVFRSTRDQASAEQVVARTMAAIEIRRGRLDRQVDEAELFIDARSAVQTPVLPLIDHESFSHVSLPNSPGPRNGVERPEQLAGPHVEGANEPLGVVVRRDRLALAERRADDHDVLGDGRRRVDADFAGLEIDRLPLPLTRLPSDRRRRRCRTS